jgi:2-aminobenzoate-CoA ligase
MSDTFVADRLPSPEAQPQFLLLDYPARLNAAVELLKGGAPDALAVVNERGRWTYGQLDDYSGRIARLIVEE